jgi:CheY-like chemotaxis protein
MLGSPGDAAGGAAATTRRGRKRGRMQMPLPMPAPVPAPSKLPQLPPELAGPGGRVLVIEDDPGIRDLLTDALLSDGYSVTATESALGAATLVRRLLPRVILLDLGLPYRSGGALLQDLKSDPQTAAIPVLIVSALTETLAPERRAMASAVIAKPFSPDTLLDEVRRACGAAPN